MVNLRALREERGLRQEDVAKRLEVDQSTVSLWEARNAVPLEKYRRKIAALYNVTIDELLKEE